MELWVAGWSTGVGEFGNAVGNSVVGSEVWEGWVGVLEWTAGKPAAKEIS